MITRSSRTRTTRSNPRDKVIIKRESSPSDIGERAVKKRLRPVNIKKENIDNDRVDIKVEVKEEEPWLKESLVLEPFGWKEIIEHVRIMRSKIVAPVDTMGCERLPEAIGGKITPEVFRYQLLVALMLSAQTKDEVTSQAMSNLRAGLEKLGGLNIQSILATSNVDIDGMICKVGFHNRKANYIKQTSEILMRDYEGDIPDSIEQMIKLPGVGPKMANLLMHRAWGKCMGIGVDVHVHRLANMWGWVPDEKNSNPEKTRIALEKWLPRDLWVEINPLLVGFGQTICPSRGKKCDQCSLASTGLCPAVELPKGRKISGKRSKKKKEWDSSEESDPQSDIGDIEDLG